MPETLNILFLAAEAEPYVKIGGLADVAGALPLALRNLPDQERQGVKLDVRLALPLHKKIHLESDSLHLQEEINVARGGRNLPAQVLETSMGWMPIYFIKGDPISEASSIYSLDPAFDREKYAFFSLAALEMARRMDWQPDIMHANDWHTALAIYALRSWRNDLRLGGMTSVLTLHNLPYMGGDGSDVLAAYGLKPSNEEALPAWARTQPLPLGLWAADAVVAVSPSYAREILTPDFGCGLESFLRSRSESITGILNGLDLVAWDPETDKSLSVNYTAENLSERVVNKVTLQSQLGLKEDNNIPLLAMIGRIDPQKGVDITLETLRQVIGQSWQFIILGTGDPALENAARNLQAEYPERVRALIRYDEKLSRLIYGGADMFLMPSRYEPCGLAQMIAMRYGCVPVVHATGGLKDTVQEGRTGFLFQAAESGSMEEALRRALSVFANPEMWGIYQRNGMRTDFSWGRFAVQYASIYRSLSAKNEMRAK